MPYPVPPHEPPALIQIHSASEVPSAVSLSQPSPLSQHSSTPQPTALVRVGETVSYPIPELNVSETVLPYSAEHLGPPLSLNSHVSLHSPTHTLTIPEVESVQYNFDSSFSFLGTQPNSQQQLTSSISPSPLPGKSSRSEFDANRIIIPQLGQRPSQPTPSPSEQPQNPVAIPVPQPGDLVEVTASRQEYDEQRQIISAEGKVMLRFRQALIEADKAQVNLGTRQVLAEGNVALTRGDQVVRGSRVEYNLVKNTGIVTQASGVVSTTSAGNDLAFSDQLPFNSQDVLPPPISDRITAAQPLADVKGQPGLNVGVSVGGGSFLKSQGDVNRLRFAADQINLQPNGGWDATNVRITNDPFSPPELELRADTAQFNRVSPLRDEIITKNSRLVFDQHFALPLFRERTIIDRRQREPIPLTIGYDLRDLDGYYIQGNFEAVQLGTFSLELAPQFLLQRVLVEDLSPLNPEAYGLSARFSGLITPTTALQSRLSISNFAGFPDLDDEAYRGSVRVSQLINNFTLTGEYSYRNRLFNGTLGYRTVHRSVGAVLTSPTFDLNDNGAKLSFQTAYQSINANTDQFNLLEPIRENDRVTLDRFESLATLIYPIPLWKGEALPATPTEGLRYTPQPVIPFLQLAFIARGAAAFYGEGYSQSYLSTSVGIQGQLGHFSKSFLDYTGFSLFYTQVALDGQSPFLFDRLVDQRVLSFGLVQQIFGGLRAGVESSVNLESGLALNNELTLEYSRRTYGVLLRINPVRRIGSLNLRISDFNWTGSPEPLPPLDSQPFEEQL